MSANGKSCLAYVEDLAWARGSLDLSSYHSFLRAASIGVRPEEALALVATKIKEAGDQPKHAKLNQQLRRAYAFATEIPKDSNGLHHFVQRERPKFIPEYAWKFAGRVPAEVDAAWLRRRSPVPVPWILTPAEFLFSAYEMGDQVLIFSDYRSQGQEIWQKDSLRLLDRDELKRFSRGHSDGVWFLSNPVDGREYFNERQQRMSRRSEESITSFRFAVLESDCQPLEQWLRILVQLPLPIVSITSSGGKSLHALVRVHANSKTDWDETIRALKPRLIQLGADAGALTAVRLTRLPNTYRDDRPQELFYLNPSPSGKAILTVCR